MRSKFGDKARLQHIYDAILEIEFYLVDNEFTDFIQNSMMRFASVKKMEIIGEASNHVSEEIKSKFSEIEWAQIVGMRNVFVREYFGIDLELVRQIIKNDLPDLKSKIKGILNSIE
jgi:uncharacterized protein with HEPN domain